MVGWRVALWAVLLVAALAFLYMVRGILLPFVVALLVSMLLDPTIQKLRMRGMSRPAAVFSVFILFGAVLLLLGIWITPRIGDQLLRFRTKLDEISGQFKEREAESNFFVRWRPDIQAKNSGSKDAVDNFFADNKSTLSKFGLPTTKRAFITQYVDPHKDELSAAVQSFFNGFLRIVSTFASQLMFLLLTPVLVLLLLLDLEKFKRRSATWIPPSIRAETIDVLDDIGKVFVKYLRGVTTAVLLYIVCASVILTALGAPYSFLLALLFGAVYLIPFLGPLISYCVLFLVTGVSGHEQVLFWSFGSPWTCAVFMTVIYIAYGLTFDQIVYPRVVGKAVGLNPVVSMFVIFSGGALFGLVGMIVAFPLAGSIKVILDRLLKVTTEGQANLGLPATPLRHREVASA
jgi:predicted PurR-regulated permease PerM